MEAQSENKQASLLFVMPQVSKFVVMRKGSGHRQHVSPLLLLQLHFSAMAAIAPDPGTEEQGPQICLATSVILLAYYHDPTPHHQGPCLPANPMAYEVLHQAPESLPGPF